jgi:hypothetical protein
MQSVPNIRGVPLVMAAAEHAAEHVQQQPSFIDEASTRVSQPTDDKEDEEKKEEEDYFRKVSFFQLFRFTTFTDKLLIIMAASCAAGNGGMTRNSVLELTVLFHTLFPLIQKTSSHDSPAANLFDLLSCIHLAAHT